MEGTSKNQEMKMDQQFNFNNNAAETDELQLSLGLSMNGAFGVDPSASNNKLKRSSSIANLDAARDEDALFVRSSSLPVENEEEVRRKKADEFAARRLEVRKKRNWKKCARGIKEEIGSNETNAVSDQIVNHASVGSQKTASSGVSVQQIQGATQNGEVKSPSSVRSDQVQVEPAAPERANAPDRQGRRNNVLGSTPLLRMPHVSTRAGENMVRGFLYKYEKGNNVKIVCVCHGLFLSPAEFVRHGGGGDVENPLRHIIVSPGQLS